MRSHSKALFAVAALFVFLASAPSALAAVGQTRPLVSEITEAEGVPLSGSQSPTVDNSDNLWVVDSAAGIVNKFDSGGAFLLQSNGEGHIASGGRVHDTAFLNSLGRLYVPVKVGGELEGEELPDRLVILSPDGSLHSEVPIPWASSAGNLYVAADNAGSGGTLYVVTSGTGTVHRLNASGSPTNFPASADYISANRLTGTPAGPFSVPAGIFVHPESGDIFVADAGTGEVDQFESSGIFVRAFTGLDAPTGVAIDLTTGNVLITDRQGVHEYDATGEALFEFGQGDRDGVVADSTGKIYVTTAFGSTIDVFGAPLDVPVADATATGASDVGLTGATLEGLVDPLGLPTAYRFQYRAEGQSAWVDTADQVATSAGPVSTTVSGLEISTTYEFRILATNTDEGVSAPSNIATFTTESGPPLVEALDPGPLTPTTAWLGANVNSGNSPTTFYVEYATDPAYASSTKLPASEDADLGSTNEYLVAAQRALDLEPATTYHYRVVASSEEGGTVVGGSRVFTTPSSSAEPGLPDGRVWERVSPSDKQGGRVRPGFSFSIEVFAANAKAAIDGAAVTYSSDGKFAGGGGGGAPNSQYLARRTSSGWTSEAINPPMVPQPGSLSNRNWYPWFADDLSRGIALTTGGTGPDGQDAYNLFLRESDSGKLSAISNETEPGSQATFRGATSDGSHILFRDSSEHLLERTPNGEVRPVGLLTDGTEVVADIGNGLGHVDSPGFNAISADGSRIFFTLRGFGTTESLFVRENGLETIPVSVSERNGDDPTLPQEGRFLGAAADGSVAYFTSKNAYTDDTPAACVLGPAQCAYLYRWDRNAQPGERITNLTRGDSDGSRVWGMVGLSEDASTVYFAATGELDEGAHLTRPSLYLWRQGEGIRRIATLRPPGGGVGGDESEDAGIWRTTKINDNRSRGFHAARLTADGRYLAFTSHMSLTAYETRGTSQVYLFDRESDRLTCVSCGVVEHPQPSVGGSWLQGCRGEQEPYGGCEGNEYLTRNLASDGSRVVFDSRDALVPKDTNGLTDVYQWSSGQLHLISSGTSDKRSHLFDVSGNGRDVFFTTAQGLVASDRDGLVDLYDARVDGRREPLVDSPCVADECQGSPLPPPSFQTPSSAGFRGVGNGAERRTRCRKGKVRRKGRCAVRKHSKGKRTNGNRRAGR